MEMLCLMHEASPYGHLLVGVHPVNDVVLARLAGSSVPEVQALLVELESAGVFRKTRRGVIYSKRMTDDYKRSAEGRKAKLAALAEVTENIGGKPPPSRVPRRPPPTQRPDTRGKDKGHQSPLSLTASELDCAPLEGAPSPRSKPELVAGIDVTAERQALREADKAEVKAMLSDFKRGGRSK
jgi:hypothetical protein